MFISGIWAVKFYEEQVTVYARAVQKVSESKFAPLDEATTYFQVYEGAKVKIIRQDSAWMRIKTLDGKVGWMKADSLERI